MGVWGSTGGRLRVPVRGPGAVTPSLLNLGLCRGFSPDL